MPHTPQLEKCSSDTPYFSLCPNPANWMLLPFEGAAEDLRSPFCNECAQHLQEHLPGANPDGFQMTGKQAHLWIAQGRTCICPHPGTNCTETATIVVKTYQANDAVFMAICPNCLSCGNGPIEGLGEVLAGFYLSN